MAKQTVSTSDAPHVILEVAGNLQLKGIDEFEVVAKSDPPEDLVMEGEGDEVRVRAKSSVEVRVPRQAKVEVERIHGNAAVKALEGELHIREIDGNLELRSVGPTRIELLRENLSAKNINGDLSIVTVAGNAMVRDVTGSFTVEKGIDGNLNLDDISGDVVAKTDENLTLRFDPLPGQTYEFTAHGNIFCRLPADASALVRVTQADKVTIKVGEVEKSSGQEPLPFEITLGDGDAELIFSAGGNIHISGQAPDWSMGDLGFGFDLEIGEEIENMAEEISQQVTQQIESQVEMIEQQINDQMEALTANLGNVGVSPEHAERIAQRAREASARATARTQERMQRAQEKIQRKMEAAQRRVEQKVRAQERHAARGEKRSWSFEWPSPPVPPTRPGRPVPPGGPAEAVSDEERLLILRMLEQKKISAEEAEQLLAALEGKAG